MKTQSTAPVEAPDQAKPAEIAVARPAAAPLPVRTPDPKITARRVRTLREISATYRDMSLALAKADPHAYAAAERLAASYQELHASLAASSTPTSTPDTAGGATSM